MNWLRDKEFLQSDFTTLSIMTFGHNADWFVYAPTTTARETAGTLLRRLKKIREGYNVGILRLWTSQDAYFVPATTPNTVYRT